MHNPYPSQFIVGSLCYIVHQEKVLLIKRARPPHVGLWSPPGGKIGLGESPQECCIREVLEETGLTIQNPTLRGIQTVFDEAYPIHWVLFIFRVEGFGGELLSPKTPEGELCWVPIDKIDEYERPHADKLCWQYIESQPSGFWQAKFVYNGPDTLLHEEFYSPISFRH